MNVEDRRKNIILFGLEENGDNASLVDMAWLRVYYLILMSNQCWVQLLDSVRKVKRADQLKYRLRVQIPYVYGSKTIAKA